MTETEKVTLAELRRQNREIGRQTIEAAVRAAIKPGTEVAWDDSDKLHDHTLWLHVGGQPVCVWLRDYGSDGSISVESQGNKFRVTPEGKINQRNVDIVARCIVKRLESKAAHEAESARNEQRRVLNQEWVAAQTERFTGLEVKGDNYLPQDGPYLYATDYQRSVSDGINDELAFHAPTAEVKIGVRKDGSLRLKISLPPAVQLDDDPATAEQQARYARARELVQELLTLVDSKVQE